MKKNIYRPSSKYNPVVQGKKIEQLGEKINKLGNTIDAISKSHENHISYLANFARHDIKNTILSMDSILTVTPPNEFNEDIVKSLSVYLEVIGMTIENFAKLVPYSSNGRYKLENLFIAVELLTRADMQNHNVKLKLIFDRDSNTEIDLSFQALLQVINNLIINALKSFDGSTEKIIELEGKVSENCLKIRISDNGCEIPIENVEKIFDYGFSTTGGSGIGLFHAKYLCEQGNGEICLDLNPNNGMNKSFLITLPINI